jgi:hypothetical protein
MGEKRINFLQHHGAPPNLPLVAWTSPTINQKIQTIPFNVLRKGRCWLLAVGAIDVQEIKQTIITSLPGGIGY